MHLTEEKIWDYIYMMEGKEKEEISLHLLQCTACREKVASFEKDEILFRYAEYPGVSSGFSTRLLEKMTFEQSSKAGRWSALFRYMVIFSLVIITGLIIKYGNEVEWKTGFTIKIGHSLLYYVPVFLLMGWVLLEEMLRLHSPKESE